MRTKEFIIRFLAWLVYLAMFLIATSFVSLVLFRVSSLHVERPNYGTVFDFVSRKKLTIRLIRLILNCFELNEIRTELNLKS